MGRLGDRGNFKFGELRGSNQRGNTNKFKGKQHNRTSQRDRRGQGDFSNSNRQDFHNKPIRDNRTRQIQNRKRETPEEKTKRLEQRELELNDKLQQYFQKNNIDQNSEQKETKTG